MRLALTDDQLMIRDAAERFLGDVSDSAAVRRAMAGELGYEPMVWRRIAEELGWCALAIDERYGGLGLGPVELVLIQEQAGRRLLCAPFFSTVCVAATLIDAIGTDAARAQWLPRIAAGACTLGVPLYGAFDAAASEVRALGAHVDGARVRLDGMVAQVADGASADVLLLLAKTEGGFGLFAVERGAPGVEIAALPTFDRTRRFARVHCDGVPARRIDDAARIAKGLPRAAALLRLYLAAEQLGCAQQCLDLTVAYTAQRRQFGRPIAAFQAVKHRCAQMMVKIEALRSAVYGAAAAAADARVPTRALAMDCTMARLIAVDAAFYCAQEAIQLHGGVGFTWEYDPQLYFKRALAAANWFGRAEHLAAELADAVFEEGV
ncbi:acyl-CoA dehydrogenase family protein [Sinimarinibacterium thermocellulolyticum]